MALPPKAKKAKPSGRLAALIRLALAAAVLAFFICAYLPPSIIPAGTLAARLWAPLLKLQFSAALYGTGLLGIIVLGSLVISLFTGRVFCSILCPLGTLQELVWRAGRLRRKTRQKPQSRRTPRALRYLIPLAVGLGITFSFSPLMMLFDPVSTFGRGLGILQTLNSGNIGYPLKGNPGILPLVLALPFVGILVTAFFRGRVFCDYCPVGLTLGLLSSAAPLRVKLNSRCVSCGICEKTCPTGCINSREKRVDPGRCVLCFSCMYVCPGGAAEYGLRAAAVSGESRRALLRQGLTFAQRGALFCGAVYLLGPSLKRFSRLLPKADPDSGADLSGTDVSGSTGDLSILPPGAKDEKAFHAHCIGCQACITACPVSIITIKNSPLPELDYASAACQYNCIDCGKVCPTGAIRRLDIEEKHRTRLALSSLRFEHCVVKTKGESCGACAEVCPTRALRMIPYEDAGSGMGSNFSGNRDAAPVSRLTRPVFDEQYCVGCGACLVVCPAQPKAFTITAVPKQTLTPGIRPTGEEPAGGDILYQEGDDFPF
ncbi:ferredoxin [Spirochaetia bacterium]|nr:ferredoxin [Spirochaetia bacterium]